MEKYTERKNGIEDELGRASIDVESLGVDWAAQRASINERILSSRKRSMMPRFAWATAAAMVMVAFIVSAVWWQRQSAYPGQDMDQFMTEIEEISDNYVPAGLYVLNGFMDEKPDAEAMVEFIYPQDGGEEEL